MAAWIEDLAVLALLLDEEKERDQKRRKQRRWSVHPVWKKRQTEGEFRIYRELVDDETKFHEYFRMSQYSFSILLDKIKYRLEKQLTFWKRPISARERLAICLRYLATGNSLRSISFSYRLGHSTVHKIVHETCKILVDQLLIEVMPIPTTQMWKQIGTEFWHRCKFPNCLGALDGKHVTIQAPPNSGSNYFNYKKTFSIVLLALVDANYNFIMVDVGSYGKNSDGGILRHSNMGKALENGSLNLPPDQVLPGTSQSAPCVIIGDEAFPLKRYLMRPFPGSQIEDPANKNFNYRLCLARRIVENAFGILSQKFRIYNRRMQANPENVDYIILATCVLHNFIKKYDGFPLTATDPSSSTINSALGNIPFQGGNATEEAFQIRNIFKNFFLLPQSQLIN